MLKHLEKLKTILIYGSITLLLLAFLLSPTVVMAQNIIIEDNFKELPKTQNLECPEGTTFDILESQKNKLVCDVDSNEEDIYSKIECATLYFA